MSAFTISRSLFHMTAKINHTTSPISLNATHVLLLVLFAPPLLMIVRPATTLIYFMVENVLPNALLLHSLSAILASPALQAVSLATPQLLAKCVQITLFFIWANVSPAALLGSSQKFRRTVLRISMFASLARLIVEHATVLRCMNA